MALSILTCLSSCKTTRIEYASDKFVVVETTLQDSFKSLAKKYLDDENKDWLIYEFNEKKVLRPGDNIVIPLTWFNLGGFKPSGYQLVSVLNYEGHSGQAQYLSPVQFREQMQFLKENNIRVISANELLLFTKNKIQIPENSVVLTFTGRPEAFYKILYPVIESYGFDATLFVDPERINAEEGAWEHLVELSGKGIDIQLCTDDIYLTLNKFRGTFKDYFFSIEKKISKSKRLIENKIGTPCNLYVYPGGESNNLIINFLQKYEFKGAFINSGDSNPFFVDMFEINRTNIYPSTGIDAYKAKIKTFQNLDIN